MAYLVTLTRAQQTTAPVPLQGNCARLQVTATAPLADDAGEGAAPEPLKIFLYERVVVSTATGETRDDFVTVCSPADLDAYDEDDPPTADPSGYFRKNTIDVIVPSQQTMTDIWLTRCYDVQQLVNARTQLDTLGPATTVEFTPEA